jgi:hypothetical protein
VLPSTGQSYRKPSSRQDLFTGSWTVLVQDCDAILNQSTDYAKP